MNFTAKEINQMSREAVMDTCKTEGIKSGGLKQEVRERLFARYEDTSVLGLTDNDIVAMDSWKELQKACTDEGLPIGKNTRKDACRRLLHEFHHSLSKLGLS